MPAAPSGINWIAGGLAAAVLLPLLAIGAGMPFWIACVVSAAAGGGVFALLAPGRGFPLLDASGAARGKIEFARDLLTDAEPLAVRIEAAAKSIRTAVVADRARHLASVARGIFAAIEKDPLQVDRVRRFLTYYLPRAAEIAEAYGSLERNPAPDAARIVATGELIDRLDLAFTRYAASLQDANLANLDIELKLLRSSLDEDLGPIARPGPALEQGKGRV
jgi:5-bromo-4-chloroindolyl phosphate hydrolysis protein